jgi:hypothetical protein
VTSKVRGLPAGLRARLDAVSATPVRFPFTFFPPGLPAMLTGGTTVGDKPAGYAPPLLLDASPAGVTGD